jgi:F420-non-reducing hydrogenase iron-sulfur subunit
MAIDARNTFQIKPGRVQSGPNKAKITVFHCFTALNNTAFLEDKDYEVQLVKMPCSSATREVFLLRAFESGADAAVVLVCPEGTCRYLQGNLRAAKRVARVKKILDEIGLDGRRLNIYNIPHSDQAAVERVLEKTAADLVTLGLSPAR